MPQPTPGDLHINVPLTNLSIAYAQSQADYVADQVFPTIPVTAQSNRYWVYPRGAWFRTVARKRAPATETPGTGWTMSSDSYYCHVWGVHKDLDDQTRANADSIFQLDSDATRFVTNQVLLKRDQEWANAYFKTGIWGTDLTGVMGAPGATQFKQWDQADSTPIQDIANRKLIGKRTTGIDLNTFVIGAETEIALMNHPQILARIQYTQPGGAFLTRQLLSSVLGVRILVASTVQNLTAENVTDPLDDNANFQFLFGKHGLLTYSNPNPSPQSVSGGYIFTWSGLLGAGAYGGRIKRFRMEEIASDRIENEVSWDMKCIAPDLGVFFNGLVA